MKYLLNAKEAGDLDRISIREYLMPSLVLMERASLALAEKIRENFEKTEKILVLCGTGNNAGDGVAAGRILSEWGYQVSLFLIGGGEKVSKELERQIAIAKKTGLSFVTAPELSGYPVLIDAIFGIGLSREVGGVYQTWIQKMNESGSKIVSVDIPSGVSATTGEILGTAVKADITVTFGENKLGMVLYPGYLQAGKVFVCDIGFPKEALEALKPGVFHYEPSDLETLFPKRVPYSNKGTYGKLLVIAGSESISGAALFAAKAAYRTGCGLVKIISHENNRTMLQTKLPEALFSFYTEEIPDRKDDLNWADAVVIGPGIGTGEQGKTLMSQVMRVQDKPVLIDADGINLLAAEKSWVKNGMLTLPDNFILTPHLKEFSRLMDIPVPEIQAEFMNYAMCPKNGAVLVLKDARTFVSDGKKVYLNTSGNHALAKGGSGDVLSGIIGGLLARGMEDFTAAALGVYLHGLAAEEYIKEKSSSSMLATELVDLLAEVLP